MIIHPDFAGIDICKWHLDVFDGRVGRPERFDNTAAQARKLAKRFKKQATHVLFEATGRYDRVLRDALIAQGLAFARVNPARARDFARATGRLAKTDALDAEALAAMAQSLDPARFVPASPERQKLAALQLRHDQLVAMRAQEKTRLEALDDAFIVKSINLHIALLTRQIALIDGRMVELEAACPELGKAASQLRSIPGIGPVASSVLVALMPELGSCSPGEAAALAGLAPFNADSGATRGKRRIKGGRTRVRKALYMAALATCARTNPFGAFYRRLIASGKPVKLALIATARKILLTANAIMRDNCTYKPA